MQQVAGEARFWWRVQEAPAQSPMPSERPSHAPPPRQGRVPRALAPAIPTLSLEIARDQRRGKKRLPRAVVQKRRRFAGVIACCGIAVLTATGGIVAIGNGNALKDVADAATLFSGPRVTSALVALGFGLDHVSVTGQRFTLDQDVFDAIDLPNVRTLWALDMPAVLRRIERISWVDKAQMTRIFPGHLEIRVTERVPAAIWKRHDGKMLVDATGRVLGPIPARTDWPLPQIAGVGANDSLSVLLTALGRHKDLAAKVAYSERIGERRWRVILQNRSMIELAAEREIEGIDSLARNRMLMQALLTKPTVVDVRTTGRVTMRDADQRTAAAVDAIAATAVAP